MAPFAGVAEPGRAAGLQLANLMGAGDPVYLVGVAPELPAGWLLEPKKPCLQMVCDALPRVPDGPAMTEMDERHAGDMLALTALVFPGFFRERTLEMGRYLGIYDGDRLAAMAGERMRLDGWQEISAVCTHPDYAGRGYAQRLVAQVCRDCSARGLKPFLHVYPDNERAIAVYRRLGFTDRTTLPLWSLHHADDRAAIRLETARLSLTELSDRDAPFILGLLNEPSFLRYIGDRGVRNVHDARRYIQDGPVASYRRNGFGLLRVALKDDDTPIGMCGVLKRDALEEPDLGFSLLPAYWSQGYAHEAASAVMRHARETLGLGRVLAIVSPGNEPSLRLLAKLGFRGDAMIRLGNETQEVHLLVSGP